MFTVGSALCAASPGLWWLVAFRGVQAVGAAALTPTSLGLLLTATPADRRVRAVRIWAATGGLAAAGGPVVGGLLVDASWRWVFLVNVPIGVGAFVAAVRLVPEARHDAGSRIPDLAGVTALVVAVSALALGLVKGPEWGWGNGRDVACYVVAAIALAFFVRRSLRHPAPVVEPALLRVRTFAWSNLTSLAFSAAFAAGLLSNVLWVQQVWHYSALRSGLAIAPGPVMVPIFAAVAQRNAARVPVGRIAAAGCVLFAAGTVVILLSLGQQPHYLTEALPGWLLTGAGVGLALPTILSAATVDLPAARAATGSAVVNMTRQLGSVLGVSVLIALLGTPTTYAAAHSGFTGARWAVAGSALIAAAAALGMTPGRRLRAPAPVPVTVARPELDPAG